MDNMRTTRERRRFKRYRFLGGGIALIPLQSATLLGSIRDISIGGVGVTYIDEGAKLNESSGLKADMLEDKLYCKDINCKSVWDREVLNDFPLITVSMRQGGLQFVDLSPDQLSQIKGFIKNTLYKERELNDADFFCNEV